MMVKDEGITLSGAANALEAQGACLESTWGFDLDRVNDRPPESAFEEAANYKITEVKMIPVDLRSMKQCLAEGYPIVFGCKLTKPFFTAPNGVVRTPDPSDPASAEHGRHAMLIVGYSDSNQTFIVRNSWGPEWGDGKLKNKYSPMKCLSLRRLNRAFDALKLFVGLFLFFAVPFLGGYAYMPYDYLCNPELNMGGQWSARGLSDYDFTPESVPDNDDLFDPSTEVPDDVDDFESDEESLGEPEEDPDGANDAGMFDPNFIFNAMFAKFDTDGSGTVSKDECKALLGQLGVPWFLASSAFNALDSDGSGTLSQEEFIAAFGSLLGLATG